MKFLNSKSMFLFFFWSSGINIIGASWLNGIPLYLTGDPKLMERVESVENIFKEYKVIFEKMPDLVAEAIAKALNKPELNDAFKLMTGGEKEECEKIAKEFVHKIKSGFEAVNQEAKRQGLYQFFSPSPWYLARYGFIFGAAVFAGFNGLYYVQQAIKDYLAIRKPKYISPLSRIGAFDQYKELAKSWIYGFKKNEYDAEAQHIVDQLQNILSINGNGKKQYNHLFIQDSLSRDDIRLFSVIAEKLGMDFIAIPSINLLQKNTIVELWNELVQLIHKNNRPILLYIDQAELLSMDGTEYSEREDNINVLASCLKSSMAVFKSKCMVVGLSRSKELLQGPFTEIFTKKIILD